MSKTKLYILFQGFGQNISEWNDKPTQFVTQLKKKGLVYIHQNKWLEQHIDYEMDYLTMDGFMKDVLEKLTKAVPNFIKYSLIPIGFSFGGNFAMAFSKIMKKYCGYCVLLDSPVYFTRACNLNRQKGTEKMMGHKFKKLKEADFIQLRNKKSSYLLDYGVISFGKWINKNIVGEQLPIKTIGFYTIYSPDLYSKEFDIYESADHFKEINILQKKNKNYTTFFYVNAGHMVYLNKEFCKIILNNI
jgi:hypothetical protein